VLGANQIILRGLDGIALKIGSWITP
jgi:hypothetical protein